MTFLEKKLIADYLAGASVEAELLNAIDNNPALLTALKQQQILDRRLAHSFQAQTTEDFIATTELKIARLQSRPKGVAKPREWLFSHLTRVAVAAFILVAMLSHSYLSSLNLGVVKRVVGIAHSSKTLSESFPIKAGALELEQGYAEIHFYNGVRLVLEGPVEIQVGSQQFVHLKRGQLVANVPPQAVGFQVITPSSDIIDLGTEFGVTVAKDGQSEVHVLTGEVKVRAIDTMEYEHLTTSQARSFEGDNQIEIIRAQPEKFMRSLPHKSKQSPEYLHWSFNAANQGTFMCTGPGLDGACYNAIEQQESSPNIAPTVKGIFDNGIYFSGKQHWLTTDFRGIGENKPRTIAFWVKAPTDFKTHQGFGILSWGLSDVQSAWQISINPLDVSGPLGRIRIGTNQGEIVGNTDLRDDEWHHIAIVMFGGEQADLSTHVLIYVDGELEHTEHKSVARVYTNLNDPQSKPLQMGRNIAYDDKDSAKTNRFFRGALDELYIFDSALSHRQIRHLMSKNELLN